MQKLGKYKDTYPAMAKKYAADGLINSEIAVKFEVSTQTIYNWKNAHKAFAKALEDGQVVPNAKVERALLTRALGFEYEEVIKIAGKPSKTVIKKALPDVAAAIFWLKNRDKDGWKDKFLPDAREDGETVIKVSLPAELEFDANLTDTKRELYKRLRQARETASDMDKSQVKNATDKELEEFVREAEHHARNRSTEDVREELMEGINALRERREDRPIEDKIKEAENDLKALKGEANDLADTQGKGETKEIEQKKESQDSENQQTQEVDAPIIAIAKELKEDPKDAFKVAEIANYARAKLKRDLRSQKAEDERLASGVSLLKPPGESAFDL